MLHNQHVIDYYIHLHDVWLIQDKDFTQWNSPSFRLINEMHNTLSHSPKYGPLLINMKPKGITDA